MLRSATMRLRSVMLPALALLSLIVAGCGAEEDTALPTPTPRSTDTAVPSQTATRPPTGTPSVTPAPTGTPTLTRAPTSTPTFTLAPTSSPTPSATSTRIPIAEQLAATGVGRYLGQTPTSMSQNGGWEEFLYDPAPEQAICLRGTRYQVNLHRGTSGNVLLYLEGGGACWNLQTCWTSPLAKLEAGSAFNSGILDFSNPANPFRDWNVVYAPYCDGSVFGGDNIIDYGGHRTIHHGLRNLSAAVSLLKREFPNPPLLVVSGSSAGGYGTFSGYGTTRVALPETPILVFDDSGPGLQNPDDTQAIADRNANWKFTQFVPADCTRCSEQFTFLTAWALERDPTLRVSYFDYLQDSVLEFFLKLDADAFGTLLRATTDEVHTQYSDRFKRFFPQGETHTVLGLSDFYELKIGTTSVRDWTADFLTNGPAWQDLIEP